MRLKQRISRVWEDRDEDDWKRVKSYRKKVFDYRRNMRKGIRTVTPRFIPAPPKILQARIVR